MNCRACNGPLALLINLGAQPLANALLPTRATNDPKFDLQAWICETCLLVQTVHQIPPDLLFAADYPFFSGQSPPWLNHCQQYAAQMTRKLRLDGQSSVVEIASNDGTLLQCFRGMHTLGIDPADNCAKEANRKGIETICEFFTEQLAWGLKPADLVIANNVVGHVPDINDFLAGLKTILKPHGTITIETPWLLPLLQETQFDTIYHEHYNYWSLHTLELALQRVKLAVVDLEFLDVHGGSLRLFVQHAGPNLGSQAVFATRVDEYEAGLWNPRDPLYTGLQARANTIAYEVHDWLAHQHDNGNLVVGAGAPAKANTLLNYACVTPSLLPFVTDTSPHKQGKYLPGSHIPIVAPEELRDHAPDSVLILAWNWADAIKASIMGMYEKGAPKFMIPVPKLEEM